MRCGHARERTEWAVRWERQVWQEGKVRSYAVSEGRRERERERENSLRNESNNYV